MHVSRSKIPSKNLVRQRCAEGFNFVVKVLKYISGYLNISSVTVLILTFQNKNISASEMLVNKILARVLPKAVKIKQSYYYHGDPVFF
jgi:hypothetical protein